MPATNAQDRETSEAAILARTWETAKGSLSKQVARHVLKLEFSDDDRERMRELARVNQAGTLTAQEQRELDNYIKVGDVLAILKSKARKLLKPRLSSSRRDG